MSTVPAIHCPECGAYTRRETQDDGTEVLICTDDDCPRIIAAVVSVAKGRQVWQVSTPKGRRRE